MQLSASFSCVKRTSELVATLPLALKEKQSDGRLMPIENQLSTMLTLSPNADDTANEWFEGNVAKMLLRGYSLNRRLEIRGRLVGLEALPRGEARLLHDGSVEYWDYDGRTPVKMDPREVLHLRGFGAGDPIGLSAIKYGTHSIGAALAADQMAGAVFANRAMPGGLLEANQTLTPEQREQLQTLLDAFTASNKPGKTMLLEAGLKWQQLQMTPEDAQLLLTRRFHIEEICRWFGVPPIVIGHSTDGQTMWGSGVEQVLLSWLTTAINPLCERIERRLNKELIPIERRGRWFFKFDRDAMLQMDSKAKAEFLMKMRMSSGITSNEMRDRLNLPRIDDPAADELHIQTSLAPLGLEGRHD